MRTEGIGCCVIRHTWIAFSFPTIRPGSRCLTRDSSTCKVTDIPNLTSPERLDRIYWFINQAEQNWVRGHVRHAVHYTHIARLALCQSLQPPEGFTARFAEVWRSPSAAVNGRPLCVRYFSPAVTIGCSRTDRDPSLLPEMTGLAAAAAGEPLPRLCLPHQT